MTPARTHLRDGRTSRAPAWVALLCLIGCLLLPVRARAQPVPLSEYAVKAALLFNIAKYANWPPEAFLKPEDPIVIGVLGDDPFGEVLDRVVRGRFVNGHPFVIRRAGGISELKGAHLVFVSPTESDAARDCAALEGFRVLTVGDAGHTALFTAFSFSVEGDKVVFSVNLDRATRAGVTISSKLLSLAKTVRRSGEAEVR
jgi:hypothetical protein